MADLNQTSVQLLKSQRTNHFNWGPHFGRCCWYIAGWPITLSKSKSPWSLTETKCRNVEWNGKGQLHTVTCDNSIGGCVLSHHWPVTNKSENTCHHNVDSKWFILSSEWCTFLGSIGSAGKLNTSCCQGCLRLVKSPFSVTRSRWQLCARSRRVELFLHKRLSSQTSYCHLFESILTSKSMFSKYRSATNNWWKKYLRAHWKSRIEIPILTASSSRFSSSCNFIKPSLLHSVGVIAFARPLEKSQ